MLLSIDRCARLRSRAYLFKFDKFANAAALPLYARRKNTNKQTI
uniref:Uncharacterized protein n=1 Tax=Siphoviridae sp. ctHOG1 TaxID=2827829 RepID=A0A8S5SVA1_9CAUD|nr:MAG TPA: hypothetical protein [Siphoviridae sp. ctHOG1]